VQQVSNLPRILPQSSLPLSNVGSALLAVDDNGVVNRLEIEALVGTVDVKVWLTALGLGRKSCQDDILARGDFLNERVLLRVHERTVSISSVISNSSLNDDVEFEFQKAFGECRRGNSLVAQSSTSGASDSIVLVKANSDIAVVESVDIARAWTAGLARYRGAGLAARRRS